VPGLAHIVLHSMASEWYGPGEARRYKTRYYGFAEATNGSPHGNGESWINAVGRRLAAIVAASIAILPRI
jgi:hypothetical protein